MLLTTVIMEGISSEELYIVKPKATCYVTRQASVNARALEPNLNGQAISFFSEG